MNKKLKKEVLITIILACIVNVLCISIWFYFKIYPTLIEYKILNTNVLQEEIKDTYLDKKSLYEDIEKVSIKYKLKITIEDYNGNILNNINSNNELSLGSDLIKVNDEYYLLKVYSNKNINISSLLFRLIIFQIFIVFFILFFILLFTRHIFLNPVNNIISDIRNYRFGKKPKYHNEFKGEFALISDEFNNLTKQLDKEKEEQNRIIASISHDIKTPLTSIIGYSDLMNDKKISKSELLEYSNKINSKALNIKDILNGFDDYLSSKEVNTLNLVNISFKEIVNLLNEDYKLELNNSGIKFNVKCDIKDKSIDLDISKIKRIFSNIISNSIRYLDKNGSINIYIYENDNNAIFKISDNGSGVKEELLDKIFNPLFTTDYSRKISGLGLSICKEFVTLHKGKIKAYNDNGLTIEFSIPFKK